MSAIAPQITVASIVCSTVSSGAHQRKHQSSTSLAFVKGIHRSPEDCPHKGPVTRKNVSTWWRHHVWYSDQFQCMQFDPCTPFFRFASPALGQPWADKHYDGVIMAEIASQIISLTVVYSAVYSGTDQSKHQSSASLAFVWGIHRGPVNSPHKWPVTRKMFPFDDVIMGFFLSRVALLFRYDYRKKF